MIPPVQQNPVQWEQSRTVLIHAKAMLHWIRKGEPDKAAKAARNAGHHAIQFLRHSPGGWRLP
jgi:hypothetical protein